MLEEWIGRQEEADDEVSLSSVRRLAALLDQPAETFSRGQVMPAHWYTILFTPLARQSILAADGHSGKGQFLPPVPLPRRMFAGRRIRFIAPLHIGEDVRRVSTIRSITPKQGRTGAMCFVTVLHEIHGPQGLAISEEQDIVYREQSSGTANVKQAAGSSSTDTRDAPAIPTQWQRSLVPDPTLIFRYSAVTFNAHRIHYDGDYTRTVEAYPALVMNGGLSTLLLWELAVRSTGRAITSSASRNAKALYVGSEVRLHGGLVSDDQAHLQALDANGALAVDVQVELVRR